LPEQLTASDIALASYERYCNSLPTIQKRMEVLLLVHHSNLSYALIVTIAGVQPGGEPHCKFVIEFAATLDIHLVFLPPYLPNLNWSAIR
jgi:hypothetical protein